MIGDRVHSVTARMRGTQRRARAVITGSVVLLALLVVPAAALAKKHHGCTKPSANTLQAKLLTPISAVISGKVSACGQKHFSSSFVVDGKTTASHSVPADRKSHTVSDTLTGLVPGQKVIYAVRIKRRKQLSTGKRVTITTPVITVSTSPATSVTRGSAVLNGTVNVAGAPGLTAAFGWSESGGSQHNLTAATAIPADSAPHTVSATLTGLQPGATYDFELIVSSSTGELAECGCSTAFTTVALPVGLTVTAPASATAGQQFTVSATGTGPSSENLGDLTSETTFTMTPDGSCTGHTCTATTAGAHTVHALDGAASGTAPTAVNPAGLDHLEVSPADSHVCAGAADVNNMEFECDLEPLVQPYTAEGFDKYGNDIGDETSAADFTAGGTDCNGPGCDTHGTVGPVSVTATVGSAQGTTTLTGDQGTPTCKGTNYDVDGDIADGCEVADSGVGFGTKSEAESQSAAASAPDCDGGGTQGFTVSGDLPSDKRVHADPAIVGFNASSGSTPDWFWVDPIEGVCTNDIVATLQVSSVNAPRLDCYQLDVFSLLNGVQMQASADTNSSGAASIDNDSGGQFTDGTKIDFEVSKTCSSSVAQDVQWTITGHL